MSHFQWSLEAKKEFLDQLFSIKNLGVYLLPTFVVFINQGHIYISNIRKNMMVFKYIKVNVNV